MWLCAMLEHTPFLKEAAIRLGENGIPVRYLVMDLWHELTFFHSSICDSDRPRYQIPTRECLSHSDNH